MLPRCHVATLPRESVSGTFSFWKVGQLWQPEALQMGCARRCDSWDGLLSLRAATELFQHRRFRVPLLFFAMREIRFDYLRPASGSVGSIDRAKSDSEN